jgi:hypothetical protein
VGGVRVVLGLLGFVACDQAVPAARVPDLYLGPPGTSETYVEVEVRSEGLRADVWRLRSTARLGDRTGTHLFPDAPPSRPLGFPTDYNIVAQDGSGDMSVSLDALDQEGRTVGHASGVVTLRPQSGARLTLTLRLSCTGDQDCGNGVFCDGVERCRDTVCWPPGVEDLPCPPPVFSCVVVKCLEGARDCLVDPRHDRCAGDGSGQDVYCDPGLGCVPGRPEAPGLTGTPRVSPEIARLGVVVEASIVVTESLSQDPVLRVDVGSRLAGMVLDPAASSPAERRYVFRYVVDGSERQGACPVLADLVDLTGQASTRLAVGSFTVDFTAPAVLAVDGPTPAALRQGNETSVALAVSEPTPAPPVVDMVYAGGVPHQPPRPWTWDQTTRRHRYVAAGDEQEGPWRVRAVLTDAAGNVGEAQVGLLVLDFTAPRPVGEARVSPPVASVGRTIVVELEVDEPLATVPSLLAVDSTRALEMTPGASAATVLSFLHAVLPGEDGAYELTVSGLADPAGNVHPDVVVGRVVVDGMAPPVSITVLNGTRFSAQPGHDQLVMVVVTGEPLDVAPAELRVAGDGLEVTCGPYQEETRGYPCAATVRGEPGEDGSRRLLAWGTDAAGNVGTASATVDVDFTPPRLLTTTASTLLARLGQDLFYTVAADEPLAGAPDLAVTGAGTVALAHVVGTSYVFRYRVTDGSADGWHDVTADLEDAVGNRATGVPCTGFALDGTEPTVSGLHADKARYSARDGHNLVTLTFDVGESLDQPPAALVVTVEPLRVTCGDYQAESPRYVCTAPVEGQPGEDGPRRAVVVAVDVAGNVASASTTLEMDFTPPGVVPGSASVRYQPPPGSLALDVTAATVGAMVRVSFALTEQVVGTPVVTATPAAMEFLRVDVPGNLATYAGTITDPGIQEGVHVVQVRAEDVVGNVGTVEDPALHFLVVTTPPDPPDVVTPGAITYHRAPWGSDETAGARRFWVTGSATPGARLVAMDEADPATAMVLGRTTVLPGGTFTLELDRADRPVVHLAFLDQAGNLSPVVNVKDVVWVATTGGKVAGSSYQNPHVVESRRWFARQWREPDAREPVDAALTSLHDGRSVTVQTAARWDGRSSRDGAPTARYAHAMTYDDGRGEVLMFGGENSSNVVVAETWAWNGADWRRRVPPDPEGDGNPGPRKHTALASDAARARVVLVGGEDPYWDRLADTWEWDGSSWARRIAEDPELDGNPPASSAHAMAYDAAHGKVVLFGGVGDWVNYLGDTWLWDGASWERVAGGEGEAHPPARIYHVMAYDENRGVVVLFGGKDDSWNDLYDTWEWDGSAWVNRTPHDPPVAGEPTGRCCSVMAYDAGRGVVVLYGGSQEATAVSEVFEWDGTAWTQRVFGTPSPVARNQAGAAYDRAHGHVLVFGGEGNSGTRRNDTWSWNGASWTRWTSGDLAAGPERDDHVLVYDRSRSVVVMVGGWWNTDSSVWSWDGWTWSQVTATDLEADGNPALRHGAGAAYDVARGRTVLHGGGDAWGRGLGADTWEWDGVAWLHVDANPEPGFVPRQWHSLAYDENRGVTVLYGGMTGNDVSDETWEWDGTAWTQRQPFDPEADGVPGPRYMHAMAYDVARQVTVLHGGCTSRMWPVILEDTWEWDGVRWQARPAAGTGPGPLMGHVMAYNPHRERVVLFGGLSSDERLEAGLWEWDGVKWEAVDLTDPWQEGAPTARAHTAMAFHEGRGRMVVQGGSDGFGRSEMYLETWEVVDGEDARGALVVRFQLGAAAVEPGAVVESMDVDAWAGGSGRDGTHSVDGARLWLWDREAWLPVDHNTAALGSAGPLSWSPGGSHDVDRILSARGRELSVALSPVGVRERREAIVEVDAVSLTLRYRRP